MGVKKIIKDNKDRITQTGRSVRSHAEKDQRLE
jgi:hypothetical protein